MDVVFHLCLPHDAASVPIVRHLCRQALSVLGVSATCVADIELAATEACTNVLKHAEQTAGPYEVDVEIAGDVCHIDVGDGVRFDHSGIGLDPAALDAETGRGVHLMRALVDSLEFVSGPKEGTRLHLVKRLEFTDDSPVHRLVPRSYTST
ncbi:MAG: ATP-binding protein [Actinomycetota bacterium]